MSDTGTVLVVDDDPSVRRALGRLLRAEGFVVELLRNAREVLKRGCPVGPTCVVLDLSLPDVNGLEIQDRLRKTGSEMGIVFISGRGDIRSSVSAMKGGAVDFLTKPFDDVELLAAVRRALSADAVRREANTRLSSILDRMKLLTERERSVYSLVVNGMLNKNIAVELGIAEKTVKVHRARMMRKMSVQSIAELARTAEALNAGASLALT